jgi:hypothetical protein
MNPSLKYTVQIITSEEQLTGAFALRYRTYKKTYPNALKNLHHPFETDTYDKRSIHLGLYVEIGSEKILAGYSRLVIPRAYEEGFEEFYFRKHPLYFIHKVFNYGSENLPLINLLPDSSTKEIVKGFCCKQETSCKIYCETSRFIIDEEHRSLSLSAFFVSGMIAICHSLHIDYCFFQCDPHHVVFYKKFGIELFPGLENFDTYAFGKRVVIFGAVIKALQLLQVPITVLSDQFVKEQRITFQRAA